MSEHPILFSGEMVRAILDGRKSETRRVIKPQSQPKGVLNPYGKFGDLLWVRETWKPYCRVDSDEVGVIYRADEARYQNAKAGPYWKMSKASQWRPSIHMPKWACRLWLRGTGVRVERLHDITETAVRAEGIIVEGGYGYDWHKEYLGVFRRLWNKLNAKRGYGWDMNPWVYVIQFERVENERVE